MRFELEIIYAFAMFSNKKQIVVLPFANVIPYQFPFFCFIHILMRCECSTLFSDARWECLFVCVSFTFRPTAVQVAGICRNKWTLYHTQHTLYTLQHNMVFKLTTICGSLLIIVIWAILLYLSVTAEKTNIWRVFFFRVIAIESLFWNDCRAVTDC